jgi:hypothetical protein
MMADFGLWISEFRAQGADNIRQKAVGATSSRDKCN